MELSENESESMSGEWSGGGRKCHIWRDFQYWSWMKESFIVHQVEKVDRAVPKERTTVKAFWVLARRFICLKSSGVWVDIVGIEVGISKGIVPCWEMLYFGLVPSGAYGFFLERASSVCFPVVLIHRALSGSTIHGEYKVGWKYLILWS